MVYEKMYVQKNKKDKYLLDYVRKNFNIQTTIEKAIMNKYTGETILLLSFDNRRMWGIDYVNQQALQNYVNDEEKAKREFQLISDTTVKINN